MAEPINVVVDLSHHNANVDFKKLRAGGIVGVIHKATQGTGFVDKKYEERRQIALDEGLLWGAPWIAQYKGPRPVGIPPTFETWTFWQYTDGVHGPQPHETSGVGPSDRDFFNGSVAQLRKLWGVA